MLTPAIRNWFGRPSLGPVMAPPSAASAPRAEAAANGPFSAIPAGRGPWHPDRLAVTDALWGQGYQMPGGEIELLRLAKPLGLSSSANLLLVGAGSGGAAYSLVTCLGVWVDGFVADPDLASAATAWLAEANRAKHVRIDTWAPGDPVFAKQRYHHALAIEPLLGHPPEAILAALSAGLKHGGQLMLTELVADAPLNPADALVARWAELEQRDPLALPSEIGITRVLGRQGYDVRVVEDITQRHAHQVIMGWRRLVRAMEDEKPGLDRAQFVLREAELWLVRMRLIREGRIRLVRWHAIGGGLA